jgi:hypothetical protein
MTEMGNIWPAGGGETGALARAPGFAPPGLGTPDAWPRSLRAVLEPMLAAKQRMFLTWGPDHILFYNDALMSSYPEQHPQAFGRPYGEYWPEQKAQFAPLIAQLNQGISLLFENMPVKARRDGVLVDRWANLSFTPLRDDEGEVAGFLCITADQTDRHLAEARERDAIQALEEKTAALEALNGSLEERIAQAVVERRLAEVALYQAQKMETIGKLTSRMTSTTCSRSFQATSSCLRRTSPAMSAPSAASPTRCRVSVEGPSSPANCSPLVDASRSSRVSSISAASCTAWTTCCVARWERRSRSRRSSRVGYGIPWSTRRRWRTRSSTSPSMRAMQWRGRAG